MKRTILNITVALGFSAVVGGAAAQVSDMGAMPLLTMETDGRTAGMAGAGVALTTGTSALFRNAAAGVMNENSFGATVFAGPWDTGLATANVLFGGSGFYKWNSRNSILAGFRYIPGPEIETMDDNGFPTGTARSRDMAADIGYARRIGTNFALSLTGRWMMSDQGFGDPQIHGAAFDLGAMYNRGLDWYEGSRWTVGLRLADIGPKIKMNGGNRYSLPCRAVAGGSLTLPFSRRHVLVCAIDVNCRFVPTGVFGASFGAEYTFLRHGVVRGGYHAGPSSKGAGSYAAAGCGFIAGAIRCDVSYRFGGEAANPLNDTFLFSVSFMI